MRGALEHASDADPADVILRETLSGNDCTAMILDGTLTARRLYRTLTGASSARVVLARPSYVAF